MLIEVYMIRNFHGKQANQYHLRYTAGSILNLGNQRFGELFFHNQLLMYLIGTLMMVTGKVSETMVFLPQFGAG
jgi:hypothetical protein